MPEIQNIDLAVTGAHILTIDADMTEFKKGTLYITGGKISWIGPDGEQPDGCVIRERIDAGGRIILPTFFNGHNHATMSIFRGLGNDLSLDKWLNEFIWPAERELVKPGIVHQGTMLSAIEMVRSGTGIFSDMYFFEDEVARVCEEIGMRCILGEAILDFPTPSRATPLESMEFTRELCKQFANHPLVSVSVAVHAPYTCSPENIRLAGDLARELDIPSQIHLAETVTEVEMMAERYNKTSVQYLNDLGFLSGKTVAHHAIHLSNGDRKLLKETGTSVVTLPNSNMKLGSGSCPVSDLNLSGITVALGTDGPASNNNQSMVREIQQLARLERVTNLDPTVLGARELVRIATIQGARAYHMDQYAGSLESGKNADFQIINPDQPHWYPHYDPYNSIAYAMHSEDVESVIINGKVVMRNRVMVNVDEQRIFRAMRKMGGTL
ncbi:MAG: amidohydrolase [Bacteroidales bacterium]|jgi:5-methylthioadenosine/S-adenosylhomocysteine deaminase